MTIPQVLDASTSAIIAAEAEHVASNYHPLPVVIARGEGAWVTDVEGKRYLDLLSAYSALNFGHGHPAILAAAHEQLGRLTLTSRAYHNDQLGVFASALARLCGKDLVRMRAVLPEVEIYVLNGALPDVRHLGAQQHVAVPRRCRRLWPGKSLCRRKS